MNNAAVNSETMTEAVNKLQVFNILSTLNLSLLVNFISVACQRHCEYCGGVVYYSLYIMGILIYQCEIIRAQ